jgi:hypothetical protein
MNNFERALSLYMRLNSLFREGRGDSHEADEVREELDPYYGWCASEPHKRLTQEERELLNRVLANCDAR